MSIHLLVRTARFLLAAVRPPSTTLCMLDPELLERITVRRVEMDGRKEQLAKQLAEARAEWDELASPNVSLSG
ncbi:hypothetical protein ACZ91_53075 [Streptomyces regensis]|nr:hypothetical protein ACZ91_53075 [Streptomyces regensis]